MNQTVPLLNPEREADVCRRMIDLVADDLAKAQQELTSAVLDRETYLLKIGAARALEGSLEYLQREYDRNFKT